MNCRLHALLGCGLLAAWLVGSNARAQTPNEDDDSILPIITILQKKDQPPTAVSITSPTSGAQVVTDTPFTLVATASDPDGRVQSVWFYINGSATPACISTQASSPFSCSYSFPTIGVVSITAKAVDNLGRTLTSSAVTVTVLPPSARQYVYDAQGRLTGLIGSNGDAARYVYDTAGNITRVDRIANTGVALLGMEPPSGSAGNSITLYGIGFGASPVTVQFNGVTAVVTPVNANQLTVTVPPGATGGQTISITTPAGTDTAAAQFLVQAPLPTPSISTFSTSGSPPTALSISGANFAVTPDVNEVRINGVFAPVTAASATSITVTIPANATTGYVTVRTSYGTAQSTQLFTAPPPGHVLSDVVLTQTAVINGQEAILSGVNNSTGSKVGVALFSGSANQEIGLGISSVDGAGSTFTILRPDGVVWIPSTAILTSGQSKALGRLPLAGTYSLIFAPVSTVNGSATFWFSTPIPITANLNGTTGFSAGRIGQGVRLAFPGTFGNAYGLTFSGSGLSNAPNVAVRQGGNLPLNLPLLPSVTLSASSGPLATTVASTGGPFVVAVDPTTSAPLSGLSLSLLDDAIGTIAYGGSATVNVNLAGKATLLSTTAPGGPVSGYIAAGGVATWYQLFDSSYNPINPGAYASGNVYMLVYPTSTSTGNATVYFGVGDMTVTVANLTANPVPRSPPSCDYQINILYTLKNVGNIPVTGSWTDHFYMSPTLFSASTTLGDIPRSATYGPGDSQQQNASFPLSFSNANGQHYVNVVVDWGGSLIDGNYSNNKYPISVLFLTNACP
jgi:YD repeat-containing protein